jgi:hypothetical protein
MFNKFPPGYWRFHLDFFKDWEAFLRDEMLAQGIDISKSKSQNDVFIHFSNLKRRLVSTRPRTVLKPKAFECPAECQIALDEIVFRVESGQSINKFISKKILKSSCTDPLLNDWGIHHFHLSVKKCPKDDRFVDRTGPLLFAYIKKDIFCLLKIGAHGQWADGELFEIIHQHWPELIRDHQLIGMHPGKREDQWDEAERLELRGSGISLLHATSDGTSYIPLGGGVVTSGDGLADIDAISQLFHCLKTWEKIAKNKFAVIADICHASGICMRNPVKLSLKFSDDQKTLHASEEKTNLHVQVGGSTEPFGLGQLF